MRREPQTINKAQMIYVRSLVGLSHQLQIKKGQKIMDCCPCIIALIERNIVYYKKEFIYSHI